MLPENNWGSEERRRFCLRIVREGYCLKTVLPCLGKDGGRNKVLLENSWLAGWGGGGGGGGANKYCVRTFRGGGV